MPQLIKNIEGTVTKDIISEITYNTSITGEIQCEDYININGYVGYLQNLKNTNNTSRLANPLSIGMCNHYNIPMITIEINY